MKSEISLVTRQYQIQQWAGQIQECQNRGNGTTVKEWCNARDEIKEKIQNGQIVIGCYQTKNNRCHKFHFSFSDRMGVSVEQPM